MWKKSEILFSSRKKNKMCVTRRLLYQIYRLTSLVDGFAVEVHVLVERHADKTKQNSSTMLDLFCGRYISILSPTQFFFSLTSQVNSL